MARNKFVELDITKMGPKTLEFQESILRRLVGQDQAVDKVCKVYTKFLNGLSQPNHTIGNFLLAGPTGSGKTRLVELVAETLLKTQFSKAVITINCGEFQSDHEIAKLIGSPPGYLGHRETHAMLSQEVLNQYHTVDCKVSIVLFDEIEKAAPGLFKLLLGVLDRATLTLGDNKKVDFTKSMIFMTSNLGIGETDKAINNPYGFTKNNTGDEKKLSEAVINASIKRKFSPEFFNRLDEIVIFNPLSEESISLILDLELNDIRDTMAASLGAERYFTFEVTPKAKEFIILKGVNKMYGARYLKRTINTLILQPFANLLDSEQIGTNHLIIDYRDGEVLSFKIPKKEKDVNVSI